MSAVMAYRVSASFSVVARRRGVSDRHGWRRGCDAGRAFDRPEGPRVHNLKELRLVSAGARGIWILSGSAPSGMLLVADGAALRAEVDMAAS